MCQVRLLGEVCVGRGILWRGEGGDQVGGGLLTVIEYGRRNSVVPQFFGKKAAFRRILVDEAAFRYFTPVPVGTFQIWARCCSGFGQVGRLRLKKGGGPRLSRLAFPRPKGPLLNCAQKPRARARLAQMGGAQPFRVPDLGARRGQSAPPTLFWGRGGRARLPYFLKRP